jgi:hypothetical protein
MGRFLFPAIFLMLVSGACRCGAADLASGESQQNPIFFDPCWDEGLAHWECSPGAAFDAKNGHADGKEGATKGAIRIEKKSGNAQAIRSKEHFPVEAGKNYFLSVWTKGDGFDGNVRLQITWYNASDQQLSTASQDSSQPTTGSFAWMNILASPNGATAPAGAASAGIEISADVRRGKVWMDDIYLGEAPAAYVNTEDYFFASDPRVKGKYIDGSQGIWVDSDPDGSDRKTYVVAKFLGNRNFEVFQLRPGSIDQTYEVSRGSKEPSQWNFRRFFDVDDTNDSPGQLWLRRKMMPGGEGVLAKHSQKRFRFTPDGSDDKPHGQYALDPSSKEVTTYQQVEWADLHFQDGDDSGLGITKVLRLFSEWKNDGACFENYDYGKGLGIVNWRYCEALFNILKHPASEMGSNIYMCGAPMGRKLYLRIESGAETDSSTAPVISFYDPKTSQDSGKAEVFRRQTYWLRNKAPQWYVVCLDRSRTDRFALKEKPLQIDFNLTEAGTTMKDLWKDR